jgi:ABC-2 type transport system permease protein
VNSARVIALVAGREIQTRVRERSFLLSGALSLLMIAAITLLPALMSPDEGPERIAATDERGARIAAEAARSAPGAADAIVVERLTPAAARRALADEEVTAIVSAREIAFREAPSDTLVAALQDADARLKVAATLERAGLDAGQRRAALTPAPLRVEVLAPRDAEAQSRAGVAFVTILLLYAQLLTFGYFVASGVVEEKSSRVVELLLAAIRPRDLLAGKVLGIGVLGLAQLAVIAGVGIATASATGALQVDSAVISAVALAVIWFVLGYAFYATLFACAGALVPRQEELQAATMPLTLTILVGFFLSFGVLQDPDGTLARVSAFVPPLAPMTLPPRIALGEAGMAEIVGGVVVCVAAILALVPLAARIYSGGLLGTRTRVGLRDAWRGTRR